ncbi:hypothetical protein Tco_1284999 [Tanacetum coccineum]
MRHLASRLLFVLHTSFIVSYKGDLYKLSLVQGYGCACCFDSADSPEESFGDKIEIGVDVVYPVPVTSAVFPASTVVMRLAEHGEAIQGVQLAFARDSHTEVGGDQGEVEGSERKGRYG